MKTIKLSAYRAILSVLLMALLVSCYTGSNQTAGIDRGGVRRTSVGPIDGFGSIISNGDRYDVSNAVITRNGLPVTQAELQVGQVVVIEADIDDPLAPVADSVSYESNLIGPVTSLDVTGNRFVALGQTVTLSVDTVFGAGFTPAGITGILQGDTLEVSGLPTASGEILATRVERAPAPAGLQLTGTVVTGPAMSFSIGGQTVDYSAASLIGFPGGVIRDGDPVRVTATGFGAANELRAQEVRYRGNLLNTEDGEEGEIEGLITDFVSMVNFRLAGISVTTNAQTQYSGGSSAGLADNVRVEIKGTFDAAGDLTAREIEFRDEGDVLVQATVDFVNASANRVTVFGVEVETTIATTIEDKRDETRPFGLGNLMPGDYLKISGTWNGNRVIATRLERVGGEDEYKLSGVLSAAANPDVTVLGKTVQTVDGTTQFEVSSASATAMQFFDAVGVCLPTACRASAVWKVSQSLTVAEKLELRD